MGLKQGDSLKVVNTLNRFVLCRCAGGRIAKIMKDCHVHFCVALDSPDLMEHVVFGNEKPPCGLWLAYPLRCRGY
jgi:hypothetical protein